MSFVQFKLDRSSVQTRGIFNKYVYETEDTVDETSAPGYFIQSRFAALDGADKNSDGWDGGYILCQCSDDWFYGVIDAQTGTVTVLNPRTAYWRGGFIAEQPEDKQNCLVNETPQVITFNVESVTSPQFTVDLPTGEVTVNETGMLLFNITCQVRRDGAGGVTDWGLFSDVEVSPGVWLPIPDSTIKSTFKSQEVNDNQPVTYSGFTPVVAGQSLRICQWCDDVTKNIGLIAQEESSGLPSRAGLILNLQVNY